ncbi:MAG: hypothetical protein G8D91_22970 [gamma proteobacterium symbiont of Clathrolucina costata]
MNNKSKGQPMQFVNRKGDIVELDQFKATDNRDLVVYAKSGGGLSLDQECRKAIPNKQLK